MAPLTLFVALAAVAITVLCLRGWYRRFFGRKTFDERMTDGFYLMLSTAFTIGIWGAVFRILLS